MADPAKDEQSRPNILGRTLLMIALVALGFAAFYFWRLYANGVWPN